MIPQWVPDQPWINGGRRRGSGQPLALTSPSTGDWLATVSTAGAAEVDEAVAAARTAFEDARWRGTPVLERQRRLMAAAEQLRRHDAELASLMADEMGMPESAARYIEVPYAAGVMDYYGGLVPSIGGETLPVDIPGVEPRFLVYADPRPVAVAALITPWNFPLLLPVWKVAAALAAGSSVVLKPAPEAPLTALALAVLLEKAGIPPGIVNVVPGGDEVGAQLVGHPGIRHVSFTGSTAAGRAVAAQAGHGLKRVQVELGGKSPALVFDDADLDSAVSQCLFGAYFNSGQVCQAASRILVHERCYEEFLHRFTARAQALRVGSATDPAADLGPVIRGEHCGFIQHHVDAAIAGGARCLLGGRALPGPGFYYAPTVLADVTPAMSLFQAELFGPVAAVTPFATEQEAIDLANATVYGLAAAVFTTSLTRALTIGRRLQAGTVWINTSQMQSPTVPVGGMKASGWGRELGRAGLEEFLEVQATWVDLHAEPPTYF